LNLGQKQVKPCEHTHGGADAVIESELTAENRQVFVCLDVYGVLPVLGSVAADVSFCVSLRLFLFRFC